jgi:Holliday junction DNA helicase RuvA
MIAAVQGTLIAKDTSTAFVQTSGGVGYAIFLAPQVIASMAVGSTVHLLTYLKVSENALELYGFLQPAEREFFVLLLSVSGIGPKTALNILSLGSIDVIQNAIARGDVKYLTAVQGMGKKTAERLVVELKSKILGNAKSMSESPVSSGVLGEVIEGLEAMGYSQQEAREAVQNLSSENKTSEVLLREALRLLAK